LAGGGIGRRRAGESASCDVWVRCRMGAACGCCGVVWVRRAGAAVSYGCSVWAVRRRAGGAASRCTCCGVRVLRRRTRGHRARGRRARGRRAGGRRAGARARGNPRSPVCDVQKGRAMSLTELELERTHANVPPPIKCVSCEPRRQSYAPGSLRMSSIEHRLASTCTSKSACARGEVRENEDDSGRGGAAARQWGTGEDSSSGGAAGMRRCSPSKYG
jgi:hypothetical protein